MELVLCKYSPSKIPDNQAKDSVFKGNFGIVESLFSRLLIQSIKRYKALILRVLIFPFIKDIINNILSLLLNVNTQALASFF